MTRIIGAVYGYISYGPWHPTLQHAIQGQYVWYDGSHPSLSQPRESQVSRVGWPIRMPLSVGTVHCHITIPTCHKKGSRAGSK